MKFGILALDYDGTIAKDGVLDSEVRAAIEEARRHNIVTVLVTGRVLSDLRTLIGDLRLFDSIVAENGAVVAFPDSGRSTVLGAPPPPEFLQELYRRGIQVTRGESVVEAPADVATPILSVIREMELPLVLLFNRGRLMVLPQAISKATGLRYAMRSLRLSEHNAIAVGDAENDHQLLESCEIGWAVGWGSKRLQKVADGVLDGAGPAAVASYIRQVVQQQRISPKQAGRRHLILGTKDDGQLAWLAVRGRNVLIAGDPRTGKSWVAGLLCEQLILKHYCVCVIDAEGDYRTLEALPGVIVLGGDASPPDIDDIQRAFRYPDVSVVMDLSKMNMEAKREYVKSLLKFLLRIRRETGVPHRIVLDEAHYFLREADVLRLLDLELAGYTLVTYQVTNLHPSVLAASEAIIVTRETDPREVNALFSMQDVETDKEYYKTTLGKLKVNEAVLLPKTEEAHGSLSKFQVYPRLTAHIRHKQKYLDMPLPEEKAFIFVHNGVPTGRRARTLKEFAAVLTTVSADKIEEHLRRQDFSNWIAGVFKDEELANQVREIEELYDLGQLPDVNDALITLIHDRYNLLGTGAMPNYLERQQSSSS